MSRCCMSRGCDDLRKEGVLDLRAHDLTRTSDKGLAGEMGNLRREKVSSSDGEDCSASVGGKSLDETLAAFSHNAE